MSDHEEEDKKGASKRSHENDVEATEGQTDVPTDAVNPFRNDKPKKKKKRNESAENGASTEATAAAPQVGPDGQPIIQSKRLKKRLKQAKVQEKRKDEDNVRTIAYLSKWLENRTEWKFEKLRQIAIQKGILNASLIPDEHFTVALDYLATTKGVARTHIIESAEKTIEKFEAKIDDENREEILNSSEYKRARDVLQTMN